MTPLAFPIIPKQPPLERPKPKPTHWFITRTSAPNYRQLLSTGATFGGIQ